jgi:hypothetical protein
MVMMFECILDYERMAMNRDILQPPYRLSLTLPMYSEAHTSPSSRGFASFIVQ